MRRFVHALVAFGLVLCLATAASAADKAQKKAQKKGGVRAVVESVDKDTLTVKVLTGKGKAATPGEEKKFKLSSDTKYEQVSKVAGQKGQTETKAAKFDDVKKGGTVLLTVKGDAVEKVSIQPGKKKAK